MFIVRGLPFQGEPIQINLTIEPESLNDIHALNKDFENLKYQVYSQDSINKSQKDLDEINIYFMKKLTYLLTTSKDVAFCMQLVQKLKEIDRCSLLSIVVKCLKDFLQEKTPEDDYGCHWQSYEVLWHCAQNMHYPDFYYAWHGEPCRSRLGDLHQLDYQPAYRTTPERLST